jgi:predicted peptidase
MPLNFVDPRATRVALVASITLCVLPSVNASELGSSPIAATSQQTPLQQTTPDLPEKQPSQADSPEQEEFPRGVVFSREYDFAEAGKKMRYSMYLPKNYDDQKESPLIVALHGLYSNPRQILSYPGFVQHAEQKGYILVAPMGYNNRGWYGSRGEGGGRGSDPKNLGELSEKDVMNVLKISLEQFSIDRDRVYLYGHSMGGGGTLHFAMKHPEIWAAMAPVAPAIWGDTSRLAAAKSIPAIVIQGDKDSLVSVRGTRKWVEEMKTLNMKHRYIEEEGGGHVTVAFKYFDEIFDFFEANPRSSRPEDQESSATTEDSPNTASEQESK